MISKKKKKKKKKKGLRRSLRRFFFQNFATSNVSGGALFAWGGLFSIFHRKSASKAQKTCDFAYFTSQWGGLPPPPPGYATASDPALRGGIPGPCPPPQLTACAPPNENCAPPSEDCALKKLTGSGLFEHKSKPKLVFFVDLHRILWRFWDKDLFFWRSPVFGRKNHLKKFRFRPENPLKFQWTPFYFFWRSPVFGRKNHDFGRKIPLNFCFSPCSFDPDRYKFLVPPCPTRIHTKNKLLVPPPKFISAPPVTLSWRRACNTFVPFC